MRSLLASERISTVVNVPTDGLLWFLLDFGNLELNPFCKCHGIGCESW